MPRNQKPAIVTLRMSTQLRDSLHVAAEEAGVSLNQYAVQVLAAAGGAAANFRKRAVDKADAPGLVDEIIGFLDRSRDRLQVPDFASGRDIHRLARRTYLEAKPLPDAEMSRHVMRLDLEDPNFYVRWYFAQHPAEAEPWLERLRAA